MASTYSKLSAVGFPVERVVKDAGWARILHA